MVRPLFSLAMWKAGGNRNGRELGEEWLLERPSGLVHDGDVLRAWWRP